MAKETIDEENNEIWLYINKRDIKKKIKFFSKNLNGGKVHWESTYFRTSQAVHIF